MLPTPALLQGAGLAALIVYQFVGISILCDEHLCPVIERLCTKLKLPTSLAGATLLAFGSSAPEIIIGACGAASNQTELSIPAILVSALIAFGAIPPLVVGAVGSITLEGADLIRDAVAYGLSVGLLLHYDERKEIGAYRAAILTLAYLLYLLFIWWTSPTVHEEAEKARGALTCALEQEGMQPHSSEHHVSTGSSHSGRRISPWLTALAEADCQGGAMGESLADPLLNTGAGKDGKPSGVDFVGSHPKFPACSPVNEGSSPTESTSSPSFHMHGNQGGVPKFFSSANGHTVGQYYEVESMFTMRESEDMQSEIKGEYKAGTIVRILELTNGRRAKVAVGEVEGWVSLVTAHGDILDAKTEVENNKASPELVTAHGDIAKTEVENNKVSPEQDVELCTSMSDGGSDGSEESQGPTTFCGRVQAALCRPFELIFESVMPSDPSLAFVVCLVLLALLSEGALFVAGVLADVWQISGAISGMTLLAFGGQIPDAIAAVELARSGMPDAAVAQAVASQVINITLGLGLPFWVYAVVTGRPTYNNHPREIFTVAASLAAVIAVYLLVILFGANRGGSVTLTKFKAGLLMAAFCVCYVYALLAIELRW